MITYNSKLMETIEEEILQSNKSNYQKVIPISDYNYETKTTLDILVEKYGGFVNRFEDKFILVINFSSPKYSNEVKKQNDHNKTDYFKNFNQVFDRLSTLEEKVTEIINEQNTIQNEAKKNVSSYLNYFKPKKNKSDVFYLVDEIINHK